MEDLSDCTRKAANLWQYILTQLSTAEYRSARRMVIMAASTMRTKRRELSEHSSVRTNYLSRKRSHVALLTIFWQLLKSKKEENSPNLPPCTADSCNEPQLPGSQSPAIIIIIIIIIIICNRLKPLSYPSTGRTTQIPVCCWTSCSRCASWSSPSAAGWTLSWWSSCHLKMERIRRFSTKNMKYIPQRLLKMGKAASSSVFCLKCNQFERNESSTLQQSAQNMWDTFSFPFMPILHQQLRFGDASKKCSSLRTLCLPSFRWSLLPQSAREAKSFWQPCSEHFSPANDRAAKFEKGQHLNDFFAEQKVCMFSCSVINVSQHSKYSRQLNSGWAVCTCVSCLQMCLLSPPWDSGNVYLLWPLACLCTRCCCLNVVHIVQTCVSVCSPHETSVFSCPVARLVARPRQQQQQQESRPGSRKAAAAKERLQVCTVLEPFSAGANLSFNLHCSFSTQLDCLVVQLLFRCGTISGTCPCAYNQKITSTRFSLSLPFIGVMKLDGL